MKLFSYVFILTLLITAGTALAASESTAVRPNIIIVYTDDQGFGDASCLNPEAKFQTPHIDRLAQEGISFTNAHSSDAVCTPSRYGLLTGRYSWRTHLKKGVFQAERACLIADGRMTIASLLRDDGYATAMVGKWHLGMEFPGEPGERDWSQPVTDMPLDKGFDYFFGIPASLNYGILAWFEGRHAAVPPTLFTNKKPNERHVDYRIMPPYQDSPDATEAAIGKPGWEIAPDFIDNQCLTRFTDKAIEWMQQHTAAQPDQPFFLYLPYTSPHYPVCPLPEFEGQGACGAYGEFVIETDYHLGRILAFLEQSHIDDNTMIIFSSDNGPESSWRSRIDEFGHHSNHIYREGKRSIYEGGHRVPFLVRWPAGIVEPGRIWDGPVGQIDILATCASLIGNELPDHAAEDSHSFHSVLIDPQSGHQRLPLMNHASSGQLAITDGAWKLVLPYKSSQAELYQLDDDPGESNDLAQQHPDRVTTLMKRATDIVLNGRTTPGVAQANDTGYWDHLGWISARDYTARQPRAGEASISPQD